MEGTIEGKQSILRSWHFCKDGWIGTTGMLQIFSQSVRNGHDGSLSHSLTGGLGEVSRFEVEIDPNL